jgi:hypothetical protein
MPGLFHFRSRMQAPLSGGNPLGRLKELPSGALIRGARGDVFPRIIRHFNFVTLAKNNEEAGS